jgi:phage major head subunit gpT-like protein
MSGSFLDRAKVEAAFVVFSTVFDMKLKNTPVIYDKIATVLPGISERVEFKWFGSIPTMKRWVGDRTIQKLRAESHVLTTEWWANGLECDVDDLNSDSRLGLIPPRIRSLATAAARRMDDLVVSFYVGGFAGTLGLTYDGQFLYDTDHTASGSGGASQSNLQTGTLDSTGFNAALEKAMRFVDDEAEPIGVSLKTVLAGPSQQLKARVLFKKEFSTGGETNIDAGMADWLISPRITGTHWFLNAEEEIKAVILGIEVSPQFASQDSPDAFEMFMRRNALYGAHMKIGLCYGFWQGTVGSTG